MKFNLTRITYVIEDIDNNEICHQCRYEWHIDDIDCFVQIIHQALSINEAESVLSIANAANIYSYEIEVQHQVNVFKDFYSGRIALYSTIIDDLYCYMQQPNCTEKNFRYDIPVKYSEEMLYRKNNSKIVSDVIDIAIIL